MKLYRIFFFISVTALLISASINIVLAKDIKQEGDFKYTVEDQSATVIEYTGKDETVKVPNSFHGIPVNSIAKGVFMSGVKIVYLPDTITEIEEGVFGKGVSVVFSQGGTTFETSHCWDDGAVVVNSTCQSEGTKRFRCLICGETKEEKLPFATHKWDKGILTFAPNCTDNGIIEYKCTVCGETELEMLEPDGNHEYDSVCDKECNICKSKREAEHSIGSRIFFDADGHYGYCRICKEKSNNEAHTYETDSEGNSVCSVCGYVGKTVENHKHHLTKIEKIAPNCTEPGNTEYYRCSGCNEIFSDAEGLNKSDKESVLIPALGHKIVTLDAVLPTDSTDGKSKKMYCSVCGAVILDNYIIPKTEKANDKDVLTEEQSTKSGSIGEAAKNSTASNGRIFAYIGIVICCGVAIGALIMIIRGKKK